jgi:hypothetical protein
MLCFVKYVLENLKNYLAVIRIFNLFEKIDADMILNKYSLCDVELGYITLNQ